jgi:hypothetical protein
MRLLYEFRSHQHRRFIRHDRARGWDLYFLLAATRSFARSKGHGRLDADTFAARVRGFFLKWNSEVLFLGEYIQVFQSAEHAPALFCY